MFAEMSLDNLKVVELRTAVELTAAGWCLFGRGLFGRFNRHRARNDLIFRCDGQFCNIEPKICQYD
jgi:hypothetical protein